MLRVNEAAFKEQSYAAFQEGYSPLCRGRKVAQEASGPIWIIRCLDPFFSPEDLRGSVFVSMPPDNDSDIPFTVSHTPSDRPIAIFDWGFFSGPGLTEGSFEGRPMYLYPTSLTDGFEPCRTIIFGSTGRTSEQAPRRQCARAC
jgi:hypothetical protein